MCSIGVKQRRYRYIEWEDYGYYYTDADGMYYIVGLPHVTSPSGAPGDTRLNISKEGYEDSEEIQVILEKGNQKERVDVALKLLDIRLDVGSGPGEAESGEQQICSDDRGYVYAVWADWRNERGVRTELLTGCSVRAQSCAAVGLDGRTSDLRGFGPNRPKTGLNHSQQGWPFNV